MLMITMFKSGFYGDDIVISFANINKGRKFFFQQECVRCETPAVRSNTGVNQYDCDKQNSPLEVIT